MSFVVFAGPSLFGADLSQCDERIEFRPPAVRGDIAKAAREGAERIGIIDGLFGDQPSVGHKEILLALSMAVPVLGAASMGALRAAECSAYGMIGVGRIYRSYRNGTRTADADVAVIHAPEELGYRPLSVAMVDVEATVEQLKALRLIAKTEEEELLASARDKHFSMRIWSAIIQDAALAPDRKAAIGADVRIHRVNQKQIDALEMLEAIGRNTLPVSLPMGETLNDTGFLDG